MDKTNGKELNIETFGEIMDEFLTKNEIQMLITLPKGTEDPEIEDNTGMGVTVQFYILLRTMVPVLKGLIEFGLDPDKTEHFLDALLEIVKRDLLEAIAE